MIEVNAMVEKYNSLVFIAFLIFQQFNLDQYYLL